jgi:hypothetical protein
MMHRISDVTEWKRQKMLDIIRRVVANPINAQDVADELAKDWSPPIAIGTDGSMKLGREF